MGFVNYLEAERRKMAEIFIECGGNGAAIPISLRRIRDELGICLPQDGRSLRYWVDKYDLKPKDAQPVLFDIPSTPKYLPQAMMTFEQFQEALQNCAGMDYVRDRILLNDIYAELQSGRMRDTFKNKSAEELLKLKQMIEDAQQKREAHLVRMTEYVDFRTRKPAADMDAIDDRILEELEDASKEKAG